MYEQEKNEIQTLKSYLLSQIPTMPLPPNNILLSSNSVALQAAISGLDKELVRLEREERLVKRFTTSSSGDDGGKKSSGMKKEDSAADMDYVDIAPANTDDVKMNDNDNIKDEEEWEEANPSPAKKHQRQEESEDSTANNNAEMASSVVARIANANIKVKTPLGALALVLHTALVEMSGGEDFRCTGVPDANVVSQLLGVSNSSAAKPTGGGGFAKPIRELARGELVPSNWEDSQSSSSAVAFRYNCGKGVYSIDSVANDVTTVYLTVELQQNSDVSVTFQTMPSNDQERQKLTFPLGQYANLDGFQTAKAKSGNGTVPPSLFYISLSELMFQFTSAFGLLSRAQSCAATVDNNMPIAAMPSMMPDGATQAAAVKLEVPSMKVPRPNNPSDDGLAVDTDPLKVMDSQRRGKHKDFEGDLLPGGPQPGGLHDMPSRGMGSQVGPNHPMFDRTFDDDGPLDYTDEFGGAFGSGRPDDFSVPGVGGGMGMHPRFDPYGPPGGPTEPGRGGRFPGRGSRLGRGRGRGGRGPAPPGGYGMPNPDHMSPPGSDYFS